MNQRDDVEAKPAAEPAPVIAARSEPAQPTSADRTASRHVELLGRLERLLPPQFEAVVFRVGIPRSSSATSATSWSGGRAVVDRAIDEADVIRSTHIHADGSEAEILWTEDPARAPPRITAEAMAEHRHGRRATTRPDAAA